ncbi:CBD9-like protein [Neurospora crassa]|nr:CBD9-like protein [Neurospora crassa]
MSLLTKAALLLAVAGSALGAPTLTNPGGFKNHVAAAGTTHHIPGHGTHFELPDHLKQRSIPGGGEIESTRTPEQQAQSHNMYTNHTYLPAEAFNRTATVTKRGLQALTGGVANGDKKEHIPMPHASSVPFVDPATGISFQRFYDETSQFSFGLALSSLPSGADAAANDATDFIGQLSFPLNATSGLGRGAGWGGISISPKLTASHLPLFLGLQTDGFGNLAFSSFTEAVKSAASGAATDAVPTTAGQQAASTGKDLAFKIRTIPSATSISATHLTYTFLCEGCLSISKCAANLDAWKAQGKTKVLRLGWAMGDAVASGAKKEAQQAEQDSKKWAYHRLGFGHLKIDLEGALSHTAEQFNGWKALAMAEEVRGFEGLAPPFAMDLVNGFSNSEGAKNLEKVKGGGGEKKEEEGEKGVESESDSDSDSDSDCGCESDSESDSDSESEDEE